MQSLLPPEGIETERLWLMVRSYQRLTGRQLLRVVPTTDNELRRALWESPRAIVAHSTEYDPVFFYGNRLALQLFEMNFAEFTRTPSRLSAEPVAQEARAEMLESVSRSGFMDGYAGMRIAKSGRRFMISGATVWNLRDENGGYHGQAAVFDAQGVVT